MARENRKWRDEQRRAEGARDRHTHDEDSVRFGGEFERPRNDGGFIDPDRPGYAGPSSGSRHGGGYDANSGWSRGRDRGAEFGRDRFANDTGRYGSEQREYGDPRYDPYGDAARRAEAHPGAHHHEYRAWREDQVRQLDADYEEYRKQRQAKFEEDFGGWRRNKYAGQNSHIGATPVEFGGQNSLNSGFDTSDDE